MWDIVCPITSFCLSFGICSNHLCQCQFFIFLLIEILIWDCFKKENILSTASSALEMWLTCQRYRHLQPHAKQEFSDYVVDMGYFPRQERNWSMLIFCICTEMAMDCCSQRPDFHSPDVLPKEITLSVPHLFFPHPPVSILPLPLACWVVPW